MNDHGITKENLMETLPPALRTDPSVTALAEALATVLADRVGELDRLLIYPAIDRLEEPLLDLLAHDFKVDWWDGNYSLEEKRRTLEGSWRVHKTLGTKAAVEAALSAIYPNTTVREWFEYGGKPYRFRLSIVLEAKQVLSDQLKRVLARMEFYKNLRSHLDGVEYVIPAKEPARLHLGGQLSCVVRLPVPLLPDRLAFRDTLRVGGGFSTAVQLPVPALPDRFTFREALQVGGRFFTAVQIQLPDRSEQT